MIAAGGIGTVVALGILYSKRKGASKKVPSKEGETLQEGKEPKKKKRGLFDKEFLRQLKPLLEIVLPGLRSKEAFILFVHTAFLVSRTFLSLYIAELDGKITKALVDRNGRRFLFIILWWLAVGIPATYVNSMIKYLESKLFIAFRTRLTQYTYDMYMKNETYYRVGNLDSRLSNPDQCLTEDVSRFCEKLAHLHSQLSKPLLDVVMMSWQLVRMANKKGKGSGLFSGAFAAFAIWLTSKVLQVMQPPFGKLAAQQAQYEGELRFVQSRLITNSEEIAFYRGHEIERNAILNSYMTLVKHMNSVFSIRIFYNMLEGFFMKYVWSTSGLIMIAIPAFLFEKKIEDVSSDVMSSRAQEFSTSKFLLLSGAEAIERVMLALKEINELAGYTERVSEMIEVFQDVEKGEYKKQLITISGKPQVDTHSRGTVEEGDFIKFENVPIVSPNGDILVERISFEAHSGMHVLITGPNGCGKSSLFRILGGLWPIYGGSVVKPNINDMFYIPQRPYLCLGTLRDQVIYPDTQEEMQRKGKTDKDLEDIFYWVSLLNILSREGGWNAVNDWKDVLSGGEKQRIGMARLLYHRPKFAILDECTSAVSIDVEGQMYQHSIDIGITLLTVTHRPSLWKYHNYLLQFDGEGGWKFSPLNADVRLSLKDEKSKLEASLAGVPKMQSRLQELCKLLGEDSILLNSTNKPSSDFE